MCWGALITVGGGKDKSKAKEDSASGQFTNTSSHVFKRSSSSRRVRYMTIYSRENKKHKVSPMDHAIYGIRCQNIIGKIGTVYAFSYVSKVTYKGDKNPTIGALPLVLGCLPLLGTKYKNKMKRKIKILRFPRRGERKVVYGVIYPLQST